MSFDSLLGLPIRLPLANGTEARVSSVPAALDQGRLSIKVEIGSLTVYSCTAWPAAHNLPTFDAVPPLLLQAVIALQSVLSTLLADTGPVLAIVTEQESAGSSI